MPLCDDFSLDVPATQAALDAHAPGLLYVTQPHAPTAHSDSPQAVRALVQYADARGWVTVVVCMSVCVTVAPSAPAAPDPARP